jgi:hypothetical protein
MRWTAGLLNGGVTRATPPPASFQVLLFKEKPAACIMYDA